LVGRQAGRCIVWPDLSSGINTVQPDLDITRELMLVCIRASFSFGHVACRRAIFIMGAC